MRISMLSFVVLFRVMKKLSVEIQHREVLDNNWSGSFNACCKGEVQNNLCFIVVAEEFGLIVREV